jgi:hypothetical protein
MKTLFFILCLLCSILGTAQFRKYSNEFLNIGAGARALAMGGSNVSSSGDATGGYWNPANLTRVKEYSQLTIQHAEYFAGIGKYDFLGFAKPLQEGYKTVGLSFLRFAVDDIPNTLFLVEPDGSLNFYNISSFSSADYAFLFSFASELKNYENGIIALGGNAKVINRKIGKFATAWGFGMDLGFQATTDRGGFGAVIKDITTTFNTWSFNFSDKEKEVLYLTDNEIPVRSSEITQPRLSVGAFRDMRLGDAMSLKAEGTVDFTFDGKRNTLVRSNVVSIEPRGGVELGINNSIFLRGGISNFQQALADGDTVNQKKVWIYQPSFGVGLKIKDLSLDYAFTNLSNQSAPLFTHVISLNILIGRNKQKKLSF